MLGWTTRRVTWYDFEKANGSLGLCKLYDLKSGCAAVVCLANASAGGSNSPSAWPYWCDRCVWPVRFCKTGLGALDVVCVVHFPQTVDARAPAHGWQSWKGRLLGHHNESEKRPPQEGSGAVAGRRRLVSGLDPVLMAIATDANPLIAAQCYPLLHQRLFAWH